MATSQLPAIFTASCRSLLLLCSLDPLTVIPLTVTPRFVALSSVSPCLSLLGDDFGPEPHSMDSP